MLSENCFLSPSLLLMFVFNPIEIVLPDLLNECLYISIELKFIALRSVEEMLLVELIKLFNCDVEAFRSE